jgi:hypothetical protein
MSTKTQTPQSLPVVEKEVTAPMTLQDYLAEILGLTNEQIEALGEADIPTLMETTMEQLVLNFWGIVFSMSTAIPVIGAEILAVMKISDKAKDILRKIAAVLVNVVKPGGQIENNEERTWRSEQLAMVPSAASVSQYAERVRQFANNTYKTAAESASPMYEKAAAAVTPVTDKIKSVGISDMASKAADTAYKVGTVASKVGTAAYKTTQSPTMRSMVGTGVNVGVKAATAAVGVAQRAFQNGGASTKKKRPKAHKILKRLRKSKRLFYSTNVARRT